MKSHAMLDCGERRSIELSKDANVISEQRSEMRFRKASDGSLLRAADDNCYDVNVLPVVIGDSGVAKPW